MTATLDARLDGVFAAPSTSVFFDALDAARDLHDELGLVASFAPPVTYSAHCPCGSVFEIRGTGDYSEDDHAAMRDFDDAHAYCGDDQ